MTTVLMPRATAVWLVDKTALTFQQIANFTGLHELEIQAIADGDTTAHVQPLDPIQNGQLDLEEIKRVEADPKANLIALTTGIKTTARAKGPKYTPLARRGEKPNAIAWILRNLSQLSDAQIIKLVGTTKPTIAAIRNKTYWNISKLDPRSPAELGICTRSELNLAVEKAQATLEKAKSKSKQPSS